MPKILLSYRRSDALGTAARVFEYLCSYYGRNSVSSPDSETYPEANFPKHIHEQVRDSDIVCVVMGPNWMGRNSDGTYFIQNDFDPMRLLIREALSQGKIILPIMIEGALAPSPDILPDDLWDLSYRNVFQIDTDNFQRDMKRLVRIINPLYEFRRTDKPIHESLGVHFEPESPQVLEKSDIVSKRDKISICYSHRDQRALDEFKTMLAPAIRTRSIDIWDDSKIEPGRKWKEEIEAALREAKVAVLLVSPHFLASDFIAKHELPPLLDAAQEDGVIIFWIYLSNCLYRESEIANYQAAHDVSRPLSKLGRPQREAVLAEICQRLSK